MDAERIPPYFADFQTLIGLPDLIEWQSTSSNPLLKRPSYDYAGNPPPHPTTQPALIPRRTAAGPITSNPPIHEAFADLARSDNEAPSYPPPLAIDPDSEDSGDWLDDKALSTTERVLSNASNQSSKTSGIGPGGSGSEREKTSDTNPQIATSRKRNRPEKAAQDAKQSNKKK
jgi:hypothetical protein